MCRDVRTLSICPTCDGQLAANSSKQWCRDARRGGRFGRCNVGVGRAEEEYRGEECRACTDVRETAMDKLNMRDLAKKRLGWARGDDSDDETGYGW